MTELNTECKLRHNLDLDNGVVNFDDLEFKTSVSYLLYLIVLQEMKAILKTP
jgi:hypothetical protein